MVRFDTRNKKPKLYNIAVLTAVTAAVIALIARFGGENSGGAVCAVLTVHFAITLWMLAVAFVGQLQYNPYSYNTIFYFGISIFVFCEIIAHAYLTVRTVVLGTDYGMQEAVRSLLGITRCYLYLSFPLLVIFSAALCVSNISLIRHEGRRVVNMLGIALSAVILVGGLVVIVLNLTAEAHSPGYRMAANCLAGMYLYFECMLLGTMAAGAISARHELDCDKAWVIVLGCGLRADGTPTPLLCGRLDRALAFCRKQEALTGVFPLIITSGGQGPDEVVPESTSMKRYLVECGVPEERIFEENRSADTLENMRYSKEIIDSHGTGGRIAFVTTNYHVLRAGLCARRVKMRAVGMGARTKWYFWPNALVREFVGLMTEHRGKQALLLGGMITAQIWLTILKDFH